MDEHIYETVKKFISSFYRDNPFVQYLHIKVSAIEPEQVRLDIDIAHEHTNVYGIAHGGVLMTIADTAMGAACLSHNKRVVTLDCSTSFIKAIPEGQHVYAIGHVVHDGSRTMVCESDIFDEKGTLYAKAHGTFFVLKQFVGED
jgi:uncharacterized protein (TIGR00369 family)